MEDALSFPWGELNRERFRALPLTVTLPHDLVATEVIGALHHPLLIHLTPFDRLIDERLEVRAELTQGYDLAEAVWASGSGSGSDQRHRGKARLYDVAEVVQQEVGDAIATMESRPLVGFLGGAADLAGPVTTALRCARATFAVGDPPTDGPSPHVVVARLPDGGQDRAGRMAEFARARDLLHPGGTFIVVAHVVDAPDGGANPRISTLVDELNAAFGGMLHVDELRSVRWPGDLLSRAVVLSATSLQGGRL